MILLYPGHIGLLLAMAQYYLLDIFMILSQLKAFSDSKFYTRVLASDSYSDLCLGTQSFLTWALKLQFLNLVLDLKYLGIIQLQLLITTAVPSKFLALISLPCFVACLYFKKCFMQKFYEFELWKG